MSRNDRWREAATHLSAHNYDAFFKTISAPVFGDIPPLVLVRAHFKTPGAYRVWESKMRRAWPRWVEESNLSEPDRFFLTTELSREYKLEFQQKQQGQRRKRRPKLR